MDSDAVDTGAGPQPWLAHALRAAGGLVTPRLALLCIVVFFVAEAIHQVGFVIGLEGHLSPIADRYSEANALRAGERYATLGFTDYAGLPDVAYGTQFPNDGYMGDYLREHPGAARVPGPLIYTHYPPAPDWIAGVLTKVFGVGRLTLFRLFPIAFGLVCMAFFASSLVRAVGMVKGFVVLLLLAAAPMFTNMMHGLHYQGYAFSLFLVQLGILLRVFAPGSSPNASVRRPAAALAALGFVQGWFSFDYFFLVSLAAVPFAFLWAKPEREDGGARRLFWCVAAPLVGFGAAHALHLVQVAVFHQSLSTAIRDLGTAAAHRAAHSRGLDIYGDKDTSLRSLLRWYGRMLHHDDRFFGSLYPWAMAAALTIAVCRQARFECARPVPLRLTWDARGRAGLALGAAFLISGLWVLVMRNHAVVHLFYISRHFFLGYFVAVVMLVMFLRVEMPLGEECPAGTLPQGVKRG